MNSCRPDWLVITRYVLRVITPRLVILCVVSGLSLHTKGSEAMTAASVPNKISQTGSSDSSLPIFSGDGSHLVFISSAKNLVANDDLQNFYDVFVRDLTSSNTTLVSLNTSGRGGGNDHSLHPSISSNGQVVTFVSAASNLVLNDTNHFADVFVRDLASGTMLIASVSQDGVTPGDGASTSPMISADGRFVVFESAASNLVPNDTNGTDDVFVRDLLAGATTLVSVNAGGISSGNGRSHSPVISSDGRFVAFISAATDLVAGVTNNVGEIYVRDLVTGTMAWASARLPSTARQQNHACSNPVLTPDGRFVAFNAGGIAVVRYDLQGGTNAWRWYPDPVSDDAITMSDNGRYVTFSTVRSNDWSYYNSYNATNAVFRLDAETQYYEPCGGTISGCSNLLLLLEGIGLPSNSPAAFLAFGSPVMSSDGNRIVFVSEGASSPSGSIILPPSLYLRDMAAQTTILLSSNLNSDLGATIPSISRDGTQVAFESSDGSLAADDLNRANDVFVCNILSNTTGLVSSRHPTLPAVTGVGLTTLSPQAFTGPGDHLVFLSSDNTLVPDDTNHWHDLFYCDLAAGTNLGIGWPGTVFVVSGDGSSYLRFTNYLARSNSAAAPLLSADGRFAAFEQAAAGYFGGATNVVRYDIFSHLTRNVGVDYHGNTLRGEALSMSQDGRFVAFETPDPTSLFQAWPYSVLISDNNNGLDVILRDFGDPWMTNIGTGPPPVGLNQQVVSVNRYGAMAGNKASWKPLVSPDGQWVIFSSLATDLTTNLFTDGSAQLFARRVASNRTKLISRDTNGIALAGGASNAVISSDSRYVFFQGASTNLAIYGHDLLMDSVTTTTVIQRNGTNFLQPSIVLLPNFLVCTNCLNASFSADGRLAAFETKHNDATPNNIFVHNLDLGVDELVSLDLTGLGGGNGNSYRPVISYDGRSVVFASKASNLVSNDFNAASDIFLRDRWKGLTTLLSSNYSGTGSANGPSSAPVLAPNGRTVAFQSFASDLVAGDFNEMRDIFVLKLGSPDTDGDGMDDDWERYYFGSLSWDGSFDFDGDGQSDLAEFRAGTDPTKAS